MKEDNPHAKVAIVSVMDATLMQLRDAIEDGSAEITRTKDYGLDNSRMAKVMAESHGYRLRFILTIDAEVIRDEPLPHSR